MPKISIALFGRNDNYGKKYLEKFEYSIRSIQRSLEGIDYEIVLLDYNPPKDKPRLSECFPNSKYPRIKHVVFSHEDHLEFIESHIKAKAKLLDNDGKKILAKEIYKIDFIIAFAMNLSIKYSSGDYVLSTGTDNIFPIQFGEFINKLEPNILYRTWMYRIHNNIKKIKEVPFGKFDEIKKQTIVKKVVFKFHQKRSGTIWSSAGNFLLMDKNSWNEVGGYIPTINPRLPMGDGQVIFNSIACGKKIQSANFPIFNIDALIGDKYNRFKGNSNYIVKKNNIKYNHLELVGKKIGSGDLQWKKYSKFARRSHLDSNKEYFIKIDYKKRLEEIKCLFRFILKEKFLINNI